MKDLFKVLWMVGGILTAIGEVVTAFDRKRGNTISEFFDRLPQPAKYFVVLAIGAVLGHWCWPLPQNEKEKPDA
jgi:hypothetical protein